MLSIKTTFACAAISYRGYSTLSLLFFAVAILDDADRREEKRRKKRERAARVKPPSGPRPF